jgi:hypothetical protein
MAKHRRRPGDPSMRRESVPRESVAENLGGAYWSVDDSRWTTVQPELPDDLADLLAPPIIVGAARVPAAPALPAGPPAPPAVTPPRSPVAVPPRRPGPPPPVTATSVPAPRTPPVPPRAPGRHRPPAPDPG